MTRSELKIALEKKGVESALLDDIVHDAASRLASNANNEGIDGQLDFLLNTCGWTEEEVLNEF
jgi:hypothetical protein